MKKILKIISYVGLVVTISPAVLVLFDTLDIPTYKTVMLIGTGLWFFTAPFWIFEKEKI